MNCFLTKQTHHWKERRLLARAQRVQVHQRPRLDSLYWVGPSVDRRRGRTASDPSPGGSAAGSPSWSLENDGAIKVSALRHPDGLSDERTV